MESKTIPNVPNRVSDLVKLKQSGSSVTCETAFEILPVDFSHRDNPFQAFIFLCRYNGNIDDNEYGFRKCYARGCPHNLCPHVSQAVMVANRYLQRDYHKLETSGIEIEKKLFTLEDMTVKFEGYTEEHSSILAIHDYINIAKEGNEVAIDMSLELVPAVEHFAHEKNEQTFLMVAFAIQSLGKTGHFERCLACYPSAQEKEKPKAVGIANDRLRLLYVEFDEAGIQYKQTFFE